MHKILPGEDDGGWEKDKELSEAVPVSVYWTVPLPETTV